FIGGEIHVFEVGAVCSCMTVLAANVQAEGKSAHDPDELVAGNGFWKVLQIVEFARRLAVSRAGRQKDQRQFCCRKTCNANRQDYISPPLCLLPLLMRRFNVLICSAVVVGSD